ncbi:TetR/AcrR family transcriptional regulator [Actinoplanes sp. TBRC 11911]|uniref:TetR/AcrR family transcriptional regulator n=1 Tax=Actinoplanes sp. TBRC 11911 TaxID=2729386 RepID=UPI00145E0752|nr:TetR/AcrR family transcriptional regulator [Actinoplanes sp. TBRC 11911]NMO49937.1 TetR/AcrR family transcriptional regulator [Actinoplanes sp. TBRC 11911]
MTQRVEPASAAGSPAPEPGRGPTKPSMREIIIQAAAVLFYAQGIRAVSADKIIAKVGITKVTFYRHFPGKDDLVVAYLERRSQWERNAVETARRATPGDPAETFRLIAESIGVESCTPGFRGCPFINAAVEYADADHPVREVVATHRSWFRGVIEDLLGEMGVSDVSGVAEQLVMLRDGAMVNGHLGDPKVVARSLVNAGRAVIESAGRAPR